MATCRLCTVRLGFAVPESPDDPTLCAPCSREGDTRKAGRGCSCMLPAGRCVREWVAAGVDVRRMLAKAALGLVPGRYQVVVLMDVLGLKWPEARTLLREAAA